MRVHRSRLSWVPCPRLRGDVRKTLISMALIQEVIREHDRQNCHLIIPEPPAEERRTRPDHQGQDAIPHEQAE
ncbi:hypothetical protein OAF24_04595 [bacterium]|nr:hypothetical protein [bacterium]